MKTILVLWYTAERNGLRILHEDLGRTQAALIEFKFMWATKTLIMRCMYTTVLTKIQSTGEMGDHLLNDLRMRAAMDRDDGESCLRDRKSVV